MEYILRKYEKATLVGNALLDLVLFPTLKSEVYKDYHATPYCGINLRFKLEFLPL